VETGKCSAQKLGPTPQGMGVDGVSRVVLGTTDQGRKTSIMKYLLNLMTLQKFVKCMVASSRGVVTKSICSLSLALCLYVCMCIYIIFIL